MKSKYVFLICIMLLTIFALGVASASDVQSNDFNVSSGDVDCLSENAEANVVNEDMISSAQSPEDSFNALENEIDNATDVLILKHNYTYDLESDNGPVSIIKDNFTLDGDGHTVDAKSQARIFNITGNNVFIKNINFVNGFSNMHGGAIFSDSNLTVINCSFTQNIAATNGGAIYGSAYCNLNVVNSTFMGNSASYGGAIFTSRLTVYNSGFEKNHALYGGAVRSTVSNILNSSFIDNFAYFVGGAVLSAFQVNITDSYFERNSAFKEAGAVKSEYFGNVFNSSFVNNSAQTMGGGIYGDVLTVCNSSFTNNEAIFGGALMVRYSFEIRDSRFTANYASNGGAILSSDGVALNCTFEMNNATVGGAISVVYTLKINDTTFKDNFASEGGDDIVFYGESPILNNVYPDDLKMLKVADVSANAFDVAYPNSVKINVTIKDSNGPVDGGNVSIIINSIKYSGNVSNGSAVIEIPDLEVGLYSGDVVYDGGANYIGVYPNVEFKVYDTFKALQEEINNASDILFLNHDYVYDSSIDDGAILISRDNFTIDGQGYTIDAKNQAGIFNITGNNVTLKNITFINGNATGNGGAVLARDLTVISSIFDYNFAEKGGAIYAENLWIYDSTFSENSAVEGGALYSNSLTISNSGFFLNSAKDGGVLSADEVNITESEFDSNKAEYRGGALFSSYANIVNSTFVLNSAAYGGAILSDNIIIVNSSFSKNSAYTGGGIYTSHDLNVTDSLFEENAAEIFGGGIYSGQDLNVTDSIFKENTAIEGGGFYVHNANVFNSTFTKNNARDSGAGFRAHDANVFNSTFTQNTAGSCGGGFMSTNANVFNSTFTQNTAVEEHGGGIYSVDVLNVSNSYFEQNRAFYAGACTGIDMMNVVSSQFINNTAFIGGAVFCGPAVIDDCIFENNSAQYGGVILAADQATISNTIFRGNVALGGGNEIVIGGKQAILNNVTPDNILQVKWVQLYAQASNVYYPQTVMIETAIFIDRDVINVKGNVSCIVNNRTYHANVVNGTAIIEIPDLEVGSYDCEVVFNGGEEYVKSVWNVSFEVYASFKALQEEINNASDILFLNHDYAYGSAVDDGPVLISKDNLVIDGQNHTIDARGQAAIFNITADNVTLKNIRLINGNAGQDGGAISAIGNLTVIGCEFTNNTAGFLGGAIYAENLTVKDSLFISNFAYLSGAIFADELIIEDSSFINNEAFVDGAAYAINHMIVCNSLFEYNHAQFSGALESPNCEVFNSTFISNYALGYAGIFALNLTLKDSKFINNTATATEGAVHISDNGLIEGVLFENNSAVYASAVFAGGPVVIKDSIFRNNIDSDGASIVVTKEDYLALVNVTPNSQSAMIKNYIDKIDVSDAVYGDAVRMTVTLRYPVDGCNVSCTINNRTYSAEVVNCSATIELSGLDVNSYGCDVVFGDGVKYIKTIRSTSFKVLKRNVTISAADKVYVINYGGKYSVTVGNLASNVKVTFVLNGKTVATATTQSKGVATFTLTEKMLKAAKAGKKDLLIIISDANYNLANKTVKITINKEKTKITAKAKTFKRTVKSKKYTMVLKNSKGKAMKKVKVYLKVKGKTYTAKTNSKGKAIFKITKLTKKGTFKATVTYKGNKYYNAVTKKNVKIVVK